MNEHFEEENDKAKRKKRKRKTNRSCQNAFCLASWISATRFMACNVCCMSSRLYLTGRLRFLANSSVESYSTIPSLSFPLHT